MDPLLCDATTFFNAVQQHFSPSNRFQKLTVVREFANTLTGFIIDSPKLNSVVVDFFFRYFARISHLKVDNDKLEGLFVQSIAMAPSGLSQPAFDQLLTAQIIGAGGNTVRKASPFINRFSEFGSQVTRESLPFLPKLSFPRPQSPVKHHQPHQTSATLVACYGSVCNNFEKEGKLHVAID
ncbi:hypothetical protein O181_018583 [Austropuccinia psidii MF-1]|uniref:Uncharacterized protein n=1 Tax=Austropuccinia psidii MF-1 TaxID=1389203 RepID=A0A9Q3GSU2_9BASI|nr:hypothetical protein [Austropuccinia psidii MF-1]